MYPFIYHAIASRDDGDDGHDGDDSDEDDDVQSWPQAYEHPLVAKKEFFLSQSHL